MRIIGGEFRSRLISMPKGAVIRPTQDKVRQAVFNMLSAVSPDNVLDLFAGSGAYGIEAISRGAAHATFVDDNPKCLSAIRLNLESLGIPAARYDIIRSGAGKALAAFAYNKKAFGLIFIDPPYYHDIARKSLITIDDYDILAPIGRAVVERSVKDAAVSGLKNLVLDRERRYGDTVIELFRRKNA